MRAMNGEQSRLWCDRLALVLEVARPSPVIYAQRSSFAIAYVGTTEEAASASFDTAEALLEPERIAGFRGALLIPLERRHQASEYLIYERVKSSLGAASADAAGFLFDSGEFNDAVALFGLFLDFSWGCYCIPAHGGYFLHCDNDRFVDVLIGEQAWDQRLAPLMTSFGWDADLKLRNSVVTRFFR